MKPIDRALELVKTGTSIQGAVKETGCSHSVLVRVMEHEGLLVEVEGFQQRKTKYDADRWHRARELIRQGKTFRQASIETGLFESMLYRWLWKTGIPKQTYASKIKRVNDWRKANPQGTKTQAARELGWSNSTLYRYWL